MPRFLIIRHESNIGVHLDPYFLSLRLQDSRLEFMTSAPHLRSWLHVFCLRRILTLDFLFLAGLGHIDGVGSNVFACPLEDIWNGQLVRLASTRKVKTSV